MQLSRKCGVLTRTSLNSLVQCLSSSSSTSSFLRNERSLLLLVFVAKVPYHWRTFATTFAPSPPSVPSFTSSKQPQSIPTEAQKRIWSGGYALGAQRENVGRQLAACKSVDQVLSIVAPFADAKRQLVCSDVIKALHRIAHLSKSGSKAKSLKQDACLAWLLICLGGGGRLKSFEIVNTFWSITALGLQPKAALWDSLAAQAQSLVPSLALRCLSTICWSFATLCRPMPNSLLAAITLTLEAKVAVFESSDISRFIWSFAKMHIPLGNKLATLLISRAESIAASFSPRELSTLLWSLATLGICMPPSFVAVASTHASNIASHFNAIDATQVLWSFAALKVHPPADLVASMSARLEGSLAACQGETLVNALWAFASLRIRPSETQLRGFEEGMLRVFAPEQVATIMWALAKLQLQPSDKFFSFLCLRIHQCSSSLSFQEAASALWAFAVWRKPPSQQTAARLGERMLSICEDAKPPEVVMTLGAFSTLSSYLYLPPSLLSALYRRIEVLLLQFEGVELFALLSSFAKLCTPPVSLLEALVLRAASANAPGLAPSGLWALCCMGRFCDSFVQLLSMVQDSDFASMPNEDRFRMSQVLLALRLEAPPQGWSPAVASTLQIVASRFEQSCFGSPDSMVKTVNSQLQIDISRCVSSLLRHHEGVEVKHETFLGLDGGNFSADILLLGPGVKVGVRGVVVEVQGPSHFLAAKDGTHVELDNSTRFKHRLLQKMGWAIVSVSYSEWNMAISDYPQGQQESQQDWLASLLEPFLIKKHFFLSSQSVTD